jgi:hypothetical protein
MMLGALPTWPSTIFYLGHDSSLLTGYERPLSGDAPADLNDRLEAQSCRSWMGVVQ